MDLFLRYIFVAILAYLVDVGVFGLLFYTINQSVSIANIIGKIATAIFGFFMHRFFTFRLKTWLGVTREAIKYFMIAIIYMPFTTGLLVLIIPLCSSTIVAKIIADTIGVLVTFTISKVYVFREGK